MPRWLLGVLAVCALLLQSSSAKRGKGKSKKHRAQPAVPPALSAEQRAAQGQLVQQGMQLAAKGRLNEAEKAFGAALAVEPTNYAALGNRALLLPQMGRAAEGVAALEHAALLYPSDPSIPYNLGTLQASLGQDADAVPHFLRARKVASTGDQVKTHATNSAGASLFKLDRAVEALHFFDEALLTQRRSPGADANALQQTTLNRAAALVKLGRFAESIETYSQAIEAAPRDVACRLSRANAWKEIGGLEGGLQSATDYVATLELMAEQGIEEVQVEQGAGGGTKERVADIYDNAVYRLQAWERDFVHESDAGATPRTLLEVSLPLWRRIARCLDIDVPNSALHKSTLSSVLGAIWGADGDGHRNQEPGMLAPDGCIAMGLDEDECDAVGQVLSPTWARNATALSSIRHALADGRPVHIAGGAFQQALAEAMQSELEDAFAEASPDALENRKPSPIRRHREDKVGQSYVTGKPRVDLAPAELQRLYGPVVAAHGNRSGAIAGQELAGMRLCTEALAAFNNEFQFQVHGTSASSIDGSVPLDDWLETPKATISKRFISAMRSSSLSRFFSALLHKAGGSVGGVGDVGDLEPILAATEYRVGDYLTVHNDLHQHAGGGRRLAVVAQLSSTHWNEGCGGALVWCDPVDVIQPEFNSLTLFATDHWSWHFVEPVWEQSSEDGSDCSGQGQHRFAWSGWYEYKTGGRGGATASAAQAAKAVEVQKRAELQWLKARLDARLELMEGSAQRDRGALVLQAST